MSRKHTFEKRQCDRCRHRSVVKNTPPPSPSFPVSQSPSLRIAAKIVLTVFLPYFPTSFLSDKDISLGSINAKFFGIAKVKISKEVNCSLSF
jgi:hypothetical protein